MDTERIIKRRFALLIGVSDYEDRAFDRIPQATNDVVALEQLLKEYDYTVRTLYCQQDAPENKPTQKNIRAELERYREKFKENGMSRDLFLVYFGGHGRTFNEKSYLIPSDGIQSRLDQTAIDLEEFKRHIVKNPAMAKILFLDACRTGNERPRDSEVMSPEFERQVFLEAEGTAILAACMKHEVAYNHKDSSLGVFTHYLLEGLRGEAASKGKPFITFDDLRHYVTQKVRTYANKRRHNQTPNSRAFLTGDPPLVDLEIKRNPSEKTALDSPANPFNRTLAIREPARFIGRNTEIRRLWSLLQGGSVAIRGEPKIGKSSMLHYIKRNWKGKTIGPINFDKLSGPEDFYQHIANELELESNDWFRLCKALESREALLLLDELDVGPKKGITHDDLSPFRALCEDNDNFKIVAASRTPLRDVYPDPGMGSPFYNLLVPLKLRLFNRDDAVKLLEHPWVPEASIFDEATRDELLTIAGLHPFKLQRAAYHCYESMFDPHYHWEPEFEKDIKEMV